MPSLVTENVSCDLCGGPNRTALHRFGDLTIVRCRNCGMVYTSPRLTAQQREEVYSGSYFCTLGSGIMAGYTDYVGEAPLHLLTAWNRIEEIERRHSPGRLLEIGCAAGFTLVLARERGWKVTGVESSQGMATYARERFSLPVQCADVETLEIEEKYDVILLDDTIEHLASPRMLVRRLRERLLPAGMLAIKTPNVRSLSHLLLGRRWFHFKPVEHLHFFDPNSIRRLLEEEGYPRVEWRPAYRLISIDYLLNRLRSKSYRPAAPRLAFPVWTGEMAVYAWPEQA